ncbi:MAG: thioredoxin [Alphaproteobacteria bacterium]|nr:thioredoxin [Alphaproteobacteria bacterium]
MSVIVTDATFQRDVLSSAKPVLVDFFTEWCAPCKPLAAALDELSAELAPKITIAKVNAETSPSVTNKYGVRGFPTMLIFKDGQVLASRSGAMPKQKLREWIEQSV